MFQSISRGEVVHDFMQLFEQYKLYCTSISRFEVVDDIINSIKYNVKAKNSDYSDTLIMSYSIFSVDSIFYKCFKDIYDARNKSIRDYKPNIIECLDKIRVMMDNKEIKEDEIKFSNIQEDEDSTKQQNIEDLKTKCKNLGKKCDNKLYNIDIVKDENGIDEIVVKTTELGHIMRKGDFAHDFSGSRVSGFKSYKTLLELFGKVLTRNYKDKSNIFEQNLSEEMLAKCLVPLLSNVCIKTIQNKLL
jgi:hypothetical protein